jgi:OOP family OmpA-OmpF porin
MSRPLAFLFGAIGLILLFLFCVRPGADRIEADITRRTGEALAAGGFDWSGVEVDGRDVVLTGAAPSAALRTDAASVAADVWGVRTVDDRMSVAGGAPAPAPAPAPDVPAPGDEAACRDRIAEALEEGPIYFEFDRVDLTPEQQDHLDRFAAVARECPMVRLELDGNADALGSQEYNMELAGERIETVRSYLVEAGLDPDRFEVMDFGENRPAATNVTPEGRAANRRVEIRMLGG